MLVPRANWTTFPSFFLEKSLWHLPCFSITGKSGCYMSRWDLMRTLLRTIASGLYFQGPGQWTHSAQDARDFRSIDKALQFIEDARLKGVEVAFAFKDREHVTAVPPERLKLKFSQR